MANNSANDAWKLTDLWNNTLFLFDSTGGWHPTNENQTVEMTGEGWNIPWDNLAQKMDKGLGVRRISLIGEDIDNKDAWTLSSALCKRQFMKLWVGEDWFYYVLGVEPRQVRDVSLPYVKTYTVGLMAMDPHYYFSNSTGGAGTTVDVVVPSTVIGSAWGAGTTSDLVMDLTGSSANEGTTFIDPVYWIIGGTSTSVTKIEIVDQWGRKLTYTPTTTIANTHVHVIMPYRSTTEDGFQVNDSTGFKLVSGTANAYITEPEGAPGDGAVAAGKEGTWAFDAFQHGAGTDVSATAAANVFGFIEEEVPVVVGRNGSSFIEKNREYPRALDGVSNTHTVTVTGTKTDCEVFAQYCVRRV